MQQAAYKYEMLRLEMNSSRTFLAIKCCQGTKSKHVIKQKLRSSLKKAGAYAPLGVKLLTALWLWVRAGMETLALVLFG
jgi:hypothetical protein